MTSRDITPLLPIADAALTAVRHRSLSDWAHVLAFGAIGWPWLLRSLSGGSPEARAALLARLGLDDDALPHLGSWKADVGFLTLIADHIADHRPETVIEFGAGASTLVAARALQMEGAGRLISFDQHEGFAIATRTWLSDHGLDVDLRAVPLVPSPNGWPGLWYDHGPLPDRIDLLLLDGPPWTVHPYGRGAADSLFDRIPPGGYMMLDDGARPGERVIAHRWRKRWPDFEFRLIRFGTKGTLIGRRER